jgi:hypothetical protein
VQQGQTLILLCSRRTKKECADYVIAILERYPALP